ncbi:MAG: SBBP repeat-containing protein, partial [Acidimicrobiales bacterium]
LNAAGSALVYSTHLGGGGADTGRGIAVDGSGAAYLTGSTTSTDFPVAAALQGTKGGGPESDAFVTKLSSAGNSLAYSTYLGGLELDSGSAIAVDSTGSAHVSGVANSELFPVERPVARLAGNQEAFVARLQPSGTSFIYSTHYGGIGSEDARAITVDASQATYVAGLTSFARVPEYFPTINAFQSTFGGGFVSGTPNSGDGFLAKFAPDAPGRPLVTRVRPRGGDTGGGATVVVNGAGFSGASAVRFGDTAARSFTVESDTRLTAVAPTLAEGIHKITVSTPGGASPGNPVAEFWAGEGSWALTGSLNTARSAHTITLLNNGKVLVAGGRVSAGANQALASAELYDPLTGTWSNAGSMAQARWAHTATLLPDGRVLVAGGTSGNTTLLATIVSIDPIRFEFTFDEASFLRYERKDITSRNTGVEVAVRLIDEPDFSHKG